MGEEEIRDWRKDSLRIWRRFSLIDCSLLYERKDRNIKPAYICDGK